MVKQLSDTTTVTPARSDTRVRQVSILSPHLYNLCTEDLISCINRLQVGTVLSNKIDTSIIAFADDLLLISQTLKGLQLMLDKCVRYGLKHELKFNEQKTQFIHMSMGLPVQIIARMNKPKVFFLIIYNIFFDQNTKNSI